jgi:alginate O-acetyltransferase complex protein AlgI
VLFNSYAFIFAFLPLVALGFFVLARVSRASAAAWLALASLFFYGYWNPKYVALLLASICGNYLFGRWLVRAAQGTGQGPSRRVIVALAIAANLLLLGYYKYTDFFISSVNAVAGTEWVLAHIVLPLGISFFTFTQIAYLVDTYQGKVRETNFVHYVLFVSYFPHLIAGPVLHHSQMMPQFGDAATYRPRGTNFQIGLAFFSIGLAKKVLLADSIAQLATPVFNAADAGVEVQFMAAWLGTLAYTLQLYFDFSGYSDMAIGISKLFGIDLPLNFNSPYKATSIIDFWRRWHMTLSQFLRDYLYVPLGGNRRGTARRYANLLITMLLGGLWHGASWTFVIWGGIHGVLLVVNHLWRHLTGYREGERTHGALSVVSRTALTFLAVVVAWVFFRATSLSGALTLLEGMCGLNGISLPRSIAGFEPYTAALPFDVVYSGLTPELQLPDALLSLIAMLGVGFLVSWALPNSQQLLLARAPARPVARWLVDARVCGLLFAASLLSLHRVSEFLYFQF